MRRPVTLANRAIWLDSSERLQTTLVGGFLIISGAFALMQTALKIAEHRHDWVSHFVPTEFDWSQPLTFLAPLDQTWGRLVGLVLLIGGLVVWRAPQRRAAVMWLVVAACALAGLLQVATAYLYLGGSPGWTYSVLSVVLKYLDWLTVSLCAACFLSRSLRGARRAMQLVTWVLILHGANRCLRHLLLFLHPAGREELEWLAEWEWAAVSLGPLIRDVVCLACGVRLATGHSKPVVQAAAILLLASLAAAISETLPLMTADFSLYGGSAPNIAWFVLGSARPVVLAGAFLILVLKYKPAIDPRDPHCPNCGYSLRGLPEHQERCPECGTVLGGYRPPAV